MTYKQFILFIVSSYCTDICMSYVIGQLEKSKAKREVQLLFLEISEVMIS